MCIMQIFTNLVSFHPAVRVLLVNVSFESVTGPLIRRRISEDETRANAAGDVSRDSQVVCGFSLLQTFVMKTLWL